MFKEGSRFHYPDPDLGLDAADRRDLQSIIRTCKGLPPEILAVDFSYVDDRILDQDTFSILTEPSSEQTGELLARTRRRQKALSDYVDKRLTCVCIPLPGVLYTIEIDPVSEKVIYWEWQQA